MTREEARQRVNARPLTDFIPVYKARNGGFVCPVCGSGENTGCFHYYEDTGRGVCFSTAADCPLNGKGSDNLGILRLVWECSENDALTRAGYPVNGRTSAAAELAEPAADAGSPLPIGRKQQPRTLTDYTAYFEKCRAELDRSPAALEYLARRGISRATAAQFGAGFDAKADTAGRGYICPRLIFPAGRYGYETRRTDGGQTFTKISPKDAPKGISNIEALHSGAPAVFVHEGIFDAMSTTEAGAAAISINSASNVKKLLEHLRQQPTTAALLLQLDSDDAGRKAQKQLAEGLAAIGARFAEVDLCDGHKDPNEALTADREAFRQRVQLAQARAAFLPIGEEAAADADRPGDQSDDQSDDQPQAIGFESTADYIQRGGFAAYLADAAADGELTTGFDQLDEIMCGWHSGVHVIGGSPGAGKTALCLQLCDGIAAAGRECLYFSLEVPAGDMLARSLSRLSLRRLDALPIGDCSQDWCGSFSALDIVRGRAADQLDELAEEYRRTVGSRVHIIDTKLTTEDICSIVRRYVQQQPKGAKRPCVFVDYLQLIAQISADTAQDAKAATDTAVEAFTQLAKDLQTHIFIVSSLNRMGYDTPADMSFFKESGGVEYSACTAMILQPAVVYDGKPKRDKNGNPTGGRRQPTTIELDEEKRKQPRSIDLSILKSRYGKGAGSHLRLDYYSRCDYFAEREQPTSAAAELAADQSDEGGDSECRTV